MDFLPKFLNKTAVFLEMIKFEHSLFALPFAYAGLFLGQGGLPRLGLFLWVTGAMVSFRTMAMGLNRLIDARLDAMNPRTRQRALPAGKIGRPFAWAVTLFSLVIFEGCAYVLGPLCFLLSPVPVCLAWLYPWTKRFTWLSHFVLGMILGIAPYGAWLAGCGRFGWVPAFLTAGVTAWVAGFDIIYALQDIEFDRRQGLYSFPARFGAGPSMVLTRVLHVSAAAAWIAAGWLAGLGILFFTGMAVSIFFLCREHWLIRSGGIGKVNEAFFLMNAVVSVTLFLAIAADVSFGS